MTALTAPDQPQLHQQAKQRQSHTPLRPPPIRVMSFGSPSNSGLRRKASNLSMFGSSLTAKRSSSSVSSSVLSGGDFSPSSSPYMSSSGTAPTTMTRTSSITTGTGRESVLSIPTSNISSFRESWQSHQQDSGGSINSHNFLPLFSPDRPPSIPLPNLPPSPKTLQHKSSIGKYYDEQPKRSSSYSSALYSAEKRKRFSSLSESESGTFASTTTYIHTTTTTTSILPRRNKSSKRLQPSPPLSDNKKKQTPSPPSSFDPSKPPQKPLPPSPVAPTKAKKVSPPSNAIARRISSPPPEDKPQQQKFTQKLQKQAPAQQDVKRDGERKGIPRPKLSLARLPKFGLSLSGGNSTNSNRNSVSSKNSIQLSLRSFSSSASTLAIHEEEDKIYDGSNSGKDVIVPGALRSSTSRANVPPPTDREVQSDPECFLESSLSSPVSPASPKSLNGKSLPSSSSFSSSAYHFRTLADSPASYQPLTSTLSMPSLSTASSIRNSVKSSRISLIEEKDDNNAEEEEGNQGDEEEEEGEQNAEEEDEILSDASSASSADLNTLIMTPLPKRKIDPSLQAFAPSSDDDDDQDSEIDVEATLETIALKIGLEHAESSDDSPPVKKMKPLKSPQKKTSVRNVKKLPTVRRKISMIYSSSDEEDFDRTLDRNKIASRASTLSSGRYSLPHRASYSSLALNSHRSSSLSSRYVLAPGFQYNPSAFSSERRDSCSTSSSRTSLSGFYRSSSTSSLQEHAMWRSYSQPQINNKSSSALAIAARSSSLTTSAAVDCKEERDSEREEVLDVGGNIVEDHDDSGESDVFPTIQRHEAITAALASLSLQKSSAKRIKTDSSSNRSSTVKMNIATTPAPASPCTPIYTSASTSPISPALESPIPVFCRAQRVQIPSASGPTSTVSAPITPAYNRSAIKKFSYIQPTPSPYTTTLPASTTASSSTYTNQQEQLLSPTSTIVNNSAMLMPLSSSSKATPPLNIMKRSASDEGIGLGFDGTLLSPTFIPHSFRFSNIASISSPLPPSSSHPIHPLPQPPPSISSENRLPRSLSPPANIVTTSNHNNKHHHHHYQHLSQKPLSPLSPSIPLTFNPNNDSEGNNNHTSDMLVVGRVRPLYIPTSTKQSSVIR